MEAKRLRRRLPSMLGGPVETESLTNGQSHLQDPEKRAEKVRENLFDNLPEEGNVEAELRMDLGDEELDAEHYSGFEEVKAAYETWMAEHDLDSQLMTAELVQYDGGGEFEIEIKEIENLHTESWTGPNYRDRSHKRDGYDEVGYQETVHSVETGDTVAVLEGEYEREV